MVHISAETGAEGRSIFDINFSIISLFISMTFEINFDMKNNNRQTNNSNPLKV